MYHFILNLYEPCNDTMHKENIYIDDNVSGMSEKDIFILAMKEAYQKAISSPYCFESIELFSC